jgi:hypothetical protein
VRQDVALAARTEVANRTRAVFESNRGRPCVLSGLALDRAHVDHIPPLTFEKLLEGWEDGRLQPDHAPFSPDANIPADSKTRRTVDTK